MIICPNCHQNEYMGSIFCRECGAQLNSTGRLMQTVSSLEEGLFSVSPTGELISGITHSSISIPKQYALIVVKSNQVYSLLDKEDYTIGRVSAAQLILPDIDLTEEDAYGQGVSRLHAQIKKSNHNLTIMDLGSSNGTRVNGQKISPHVEYPIENNDIVALGKLKLRIITQNDEE